MQVAIDGPAGAGKSTIAKRIASERGYIYVDTGAMYRAMALYLIRRGIEADDTAGIEAACEDADISIRYINGEQNVILNGENVSGLIRTQEVSNMASASSVNGKVREKLVDLQRKLASETDVVMDGRDIGTVVLPDAGVKIYLTASVNVRAKRRYDELTARGESADLAVIEAEIKERDERDMTRKISPLKKADDAVTVDTSDMNIEEVVKVIDEIINEAAGK
ncbi:MAG: (d)CMP kinase [Lachnospiraceae bacterium]|nr:(d)CMP kinase [Lachnospiraceae bacterium]